MSVLIDTNVIMDALIERAGFVVHARELLERVESGQLNALLCATTVTTIDYLAARELGRLPARQALGRLLSLFDVAAVTRTVLQNAINSPMPDFEDAVIAHAALKAGAQAIITRNLKDFTRSPVPAYSPEQWLAMPA